MNMRPNDPYLASFPRPVADNGIGLHFCLDVRPSNVNQYAQLFRNAGIKWSCIYGDDEQTTVKAAKALFQAAGVVSVIRIQATGTMPKSLSSWAAYVRYAMSEGVIPYFKVFNEPGDPREEWGSYEEFARKWNERADVIVAEGGYPGLQVLDREALRAACSGMSDAVKRRFFFSLHNYGANHPPQYPYPNQTALEDDTCVLRFLSFAQWFKEELGFVPPMIGAEGGWLYANQDDSSYEPVYINKWVAWHKEMFSWMRTGRLSNGEPLPDYLFCVTPWLANAANWYSDSWWWGLQYDKEDEQFWNTSDPFYREYDKKELIEWLSLNSHYVRRFEDEGVEADPVLLEEAVKAMVAKEKWMPVNNGGALWKFAKANGLQDQQTDELKLVFGNTTYIAQVFNLGIVYAKIGDWDNIQIIRK